jgi:hypothetical protein
MGGHGSRERRSIEGHFRIIASEIRNEGRSSLQERAALSAGRSLSYFCPHTAALKECSAAIHVDGLTCHGAGSVGAKEQRRMRDFVGGLPAALQNGLQEAGKLFF